MRVPKPEARPYHHGDLRRGLVSAARRLLEAEGVAALSLRAVAREAGVSPAAPYHHFKDKSELLDAVADEGWALAGEAMSEALNAARDAEDQLLSVVLAYVRFARERPALYRVMYEAAREKASLPMEVHAGDRSAYTLVRQALMQGGATPTWQDVELAISAAWCAAHGLAEMAGFKQFENLKAQLGGEAPFLDAVLRHMGLYRGAASR
jgi:AcrR family transcriptional regulator